MAVGKQPDRREEGEKQGILGGGVSGALSPDRPGAWLTPPGMSLSHSYLHLQTSYTPTKDIQMLKHWCVCVFTIVCVHSHDCIYSHVFHILKRLSFLLFMWLVLIWLHQAFSVCLPLWFVRFLYLRLSHCRQPYQPIREVTRTAICVLSITSSVLSRTEKS